jgi:hypothetical protein
VRTPCPPTHLNSSFPQTIPGVQSNNSLPGFHLSIDIFLSLQLLQCSTDKAPAKLSPCHTIGFFAFHPLFASPGNTLHTATSYSELGFHLYARMRSAAHVFYLAVFALLSPSHADGQTATKSRSQSPDTCAVCFQYDSRPVPSN